MSNVVVLASRATVESEVFSAIRSSATEARAFITGIDPRNLDIAYKESRDIIDYQIDVQLMDILVMAIELSQGKAPYTMPYGSEYDSARRMLIYLPEAAKLNYQELMEKNKLLVEHIESLA